MSARLRVDQARWWLLTYHPFYGSLAMSLPDVFSTSTQTAETDGRVIRWNPEFVDGLTDEELRFVLAHETLHNAHQHLWRVPATEQGNEAGDHEINLTLQAIDGMKMPEGGLADPQYAGLAVEEILARLQQQEQQQGGQGQGGGEQQQQQSGGGQSGNQQGQQQSGGDGRGQQGQPGQSGGKPDPTGSFTAPAPGDKPGDTADSLRDDWQSRVQQAAMAHQALGAGDIPGDMQRILDRILHQTVDWKREMADFVRDAMSSRNDWSRSARRHAWQSVIYPRKRPDELGKVVFVRDTSGSVNDRTVAVYTALITDAMGETGASGLVIDADSRIQAEYEVDQYQPAPLTAKGGGGTKFRPVFDRVDELVASGEHVAGVVYLTDMHSSDGWPESDIPTLWLATSDVVAPFGRTVRIEN